MYLTEDQLAEIEAEEIVKSDAYFGARPKGADAISSRKLFSAGFERGYKAALDNTAKKDSEIKHNSTICGKIL